MSRRAAMALLLAAAFIGTIACLDSSGPVNTLEPLPGLLVSHPVDAPPAAGNVTASAVAAPAAAQVVYVSMIPGTVPTGVQATIRDQATGASVTIAVVDGGFDPVAIAAEIGDTLQVEITRMDADPLKGSDLVRPIRPPTVVRTSPPKGGHDVPLNAVIVVVFNEPIDSATLTTGSVQLLRDTTPVAGTVRFGDLAHIRAEFHPDSLLAGTTDYRLIVTQGVRDVNGEALVSPLDVTFTTGTIGPATGLVFASVSGGSFYSCGLTTTGAAYCWGTNWAGQLGNALTAQGLTPVPVDGGLRFVSLSAGENQACGVTTSSAAYCWGNLGYGDVPLDSATLSACQTFWRCPTPVSVPGGVTFTAVSAGSTQRCGITTTGAAYCWGNGWGPLGFDDTTFSSIPIAVPGGLTFTAVSSGGYDCGVTTTGGVYCWGRGRLGDSTTTVISPVPVQVAGGLTFKTVSAGEVHACGVTTAGAAYCWGDNNWGELGDGTTTESSVPVAVVGGHTFATISANGLSTCGVTTDSTAYCWGADSLAYAGFNGGGPPRSTPVAVAGGLPFAMVSAGFGSHRCGVSTSGTAYCWGANINGELGDGTTTNSAEPVRVAGQP